MTTTADHLLAAIESGSLDGDIHISNNSPAAIAIMVGRIEVFRMGCLQIERPTAKVTEDGKSVDIFPSPGMPDGFAIGVGGHEEAILIAEALDDIFETAYLELYDVDE